MPVHSVDDARFWDLAPESMRYAQTAVSEVLNIKIAVFPLAGEAGVDEHGHPKGPLMLVAEFPPNAFVPSHAHTVQRTEFVVRGELQVGDKTIRPGDVMISAAEEVYGPLQTGPEGCVTVEIFADASGFLGGIIMGDTSDRAKELLGRLQSYVPFKVTAG